MARPASAINNKALGTIHPNAHQCAAHVRMALGILNYFNYYAIAISSVEELAAKHPSYIQVISVDDKAKVINTIENC